MGDGDSLNVGEVNVSESETSLTKVPNFAKGDVAIAFHVICQERVGVQGRASVEWRKNHLPTPHGHGVVGILGDGDPQDLLDAGVVGWSIDGNLGVYGNAGVLNKGIGVLGVSGVDNGGAGSQTFPAGVGGRGRSEFGVHGVSDSGDGVRGDSATGAGVVGTSPDVIGVLGVQGTGPDLRDTAGGFGGAAVTGSADEGIGVLGHSNQNPGVRGDSTEDSGVVGISDIAAGVEGRSRTEFGVLGLGPVGVKGVATDGIGVVGLNGVGVDPTTIGAFGVAGTSDVAPGVLGHSNSAAGVTGESVQGIGVFGLHGTAHDLTPFSQAGVVGFSPDTPGLLGRSGSDAGIRGESTGGPAIHGISTSPGGVAGQFDGNVIVNGDLNVSGAKSAVVHSRDGSLRKLYAVESPESWFEDFGTAQLEYGHAQVRLDASYAALIRSDDYRVFLTPLGDCKGLYVDARSPQGFEVHELQGGTKCIRFDYRVVAKRADITAPRLERV